jgi:hypothetical protein
MMNHNSRSVSLDSNSVKLFLRPKFTNTNYEGSFSSGMKLGNHNLLNIKGVYRRLKPPHSRITRKIYFERRILI